jgi:hypothetical protein
VSEEDQIRRLLAEAKHDDPIPPDVAARMDGVIADLRADRPVRPTVTSLTAARRRRRARTMLIAAAAVVVAGIGIDQLRGASLTADDGDSAGSSADNGTSAESQAGGGRDGVAADAPRTPTPRDFSVARRISSDHFAADVERLRGQRAAYGNSVTDGARGDAALKSVDCRRPGRGRVVEVLYDGTPALLVYRPVHGDTQIVDLIVCGSGTTRSVTLRAP